MSSEDPAPRTVVVPTRDGYDRWSTLYDDEDNPVVLLESRHLPGWLGEVRGQAVLDVGCGTGRHAVPLARAGGQLTGLDFSEGMLARARAKAAAAGVPVRLLLHDLARPLPFAASSFALVFSSLVLEHIADLDALFAELARVCCPAGAVVLSTMHPAMMLRGASARFADPVTGEKVYPRSHEQTISDYVLAATRAGLTFERMSEVRVDEALVACSPRAERYLGWPMLLLMRLRPASGA